MVNTIKGFKDVTMSFFAPSIKDHIFYTLFVVSGSIVLGDRSSDMCYSNDVGFDTSSSSMFYFASVNTAALSCQHGIRVSHHSYTAALAFLVLHLQDLL
ncbi:hypothetical protein Tco_1436425, partial [Tanacetum coccineum]